MDSLKSLCYCLRLGLSKTIIVSCLRPSWKGRTSRGSLPAVLSLESLLSWPPAACVLGAGVAGTCIYQALSKFTPRPSGFQFERLTVFVLRKGLILVQLSSNFQQSSCLSFSGDAEITSASCYSQEQSRSQASPGQMTYFLEDSGRWPGPEG